MKKTMKIMVALVALGLVISVGVTAAKAPVTVTHYGYPGNGQKFRDWINWAAERFMAENPDIKIEIMVAASGPEYRTKFPVMYATGVASDVQEYSMMEWVTGGYYLDVKSYMERDGVKRILWPNNVIDAYLTDGKQWGMPYQLYPYLYWFNSDLFAQNGLANPNELGEAWNWDNLRSAARKITRDENGDSVMDYYGIDTLWATWSNGTAVMQAGGQLYDKYDNPTESRMNTSEVRTALEWVTDLYVKDKVTPPYNASSADINKFYIWNGRTGMAVHWGPTVIGTYFINAQCNWDIALPVKGPAQRGTIFTGGAFHISNTTAHPEEAWRWVKFLTTNREVTDRQIEMSGVMPALRSSFTSYAKLVNPVPKSVNLIFETMMSPVTRYAYRITAPGAGTFSALMKPVFTGEKSPSVALQEAHETAQAKFAEFAAQQAKAK